jgi:hypothetical protein
LITAGLEIYNFRNHVASDIGTDQLFLPSGNVESQQFMDNICEWTNLQKMKLNENKSKVMVFNCTRMFQFLARIHLNDTLKGYQRTSILRKLYEFDIQAEDLLLIYNQYIRSILEYNSNVWYSSITNKEREDIERVQHVACKIILKDEYESYSEALEKLN